MSIDSKEAIYPISVAARLLGVHPRTLRIYEEEELVKPTRKGSKRYYSNDDIEWIRCLRELIHDKGISIPGIKLLLELTPCWEIRKCSAAELATCTAFVCPPARSQRGRTHDGRPASLHDSRASSDRCSPSPSCIQ